MKKFLKWFLIIVIGLGVILFVAFKILQSNTKKFSPEEEIAFVQNDLEVDVFYNRPSKKGRPIFGGLVPYGEVWRTGANEATTFATNQDIMVMDKKLPKGEYTLWTIPREESWQVIFNGKDYGWGVNFNGVASREAEFDVLNVTVPSEKVANVTEQFTITIEEGNPIIMKLAWDKTEVNVPIEPAN